MKTNRLERIRLDMVELYEEALDEFEWSFENENNHEEILATPYYTNSLLDEMAAFKKTIVEIDRRLKKYL